MPIAGHEFKLVSQTSSDNMKNIFLGSSECRKGKSKKDERDKKMFTPVSQKGIELSEQKCWHACRRFAFFSSLHSILLGYPTIGARQSSSV